MNQRTMVFVTLLAFQVSALQAQEESAAWWNPFSKSSVSEDSEVRQSSFFDGAAADKEPLFSMPKLPWSTAKTEPKPKGDSMFGKMGRTTKKMWGNTVDFLNPFDKPQAKVNQGYQPQGTTEKSGGGMFGWMWREQRTETPASVNDFLRQPRPRP